MLEFNKFLKNWVLNLILELFLHNAKFYIDYQLDT
jgi:hypothetical protein